VRKGFSRVSASPHWPAAGRFAVDDGPLFRFARLSSPAFRSKTLASGGAGMPGKIRNNGYGFSRTNDFVCPKDHAQSKSRRAMATRSKTIAR
jgi:hypothetical protein